MAIATLCLALEEDEGSVAEEEEEGRVRMRSPRIQASAWMTVRPARIIFCVPWIWERRETLLPVSLEGKVRKTGLREAQRMGKGKEDRTVSMYSPLACLGGIL